MARIAQAQGVDDSGIDSGMEELEALEEEPEFEGVAEVEAPPREPTRHTLDEDQLTTVPGTGGDALRAIEIMPGVSRTQYGTNPGPPLLRGSQSSESLVLINGAQVPLLYHFGGLTSVFNSRLIESVTLYPGNYSARFGRAAGGVVEVKVRDPKEDRLHGLLELSAIDSSALVEGPLGGGTSVALAARRSNIDWFIDALITEDSTTVVAAPVYWDYQAILAHRFDEANQLRFLAYGSADALELEFGEALGDDPALRGEFAARDSFHRVQLELETRFSSVVQQELMLSVGPSPGKGQLGDGIAYDYSTWDLNARANWSIFAAPWLRLDTGFDVQGLDAVFTYTGPAPGATEGLPSQGSVASERPVVLDSTIRLLRPGAYVEASLRPSPRLLLLSGLRADYSTDNDAVSIDPRFAGRLEVASTTTLKAGVGYYSQPAQFWEAFDEFGNPDLDPMRTLQMSAGVEQALGEFVHVDAEGFYKHWEDRIVGTPGGAPPRYINAGTGDAYGFELLAGAQFTRKSQVLLAYTLSRSTREDGPGEPTRLFDKDQTHNVSLVASYDLGEGWLAGARFRYVTGNPYSPVVASVYDASSDTYRPLYGGVNEARNAAFHQLDLRVEKLWMVGPVALTTYVEIMNVYNAENQEALRYSFDYDESESVVGMPFFPNLGIRGEL